MAEQLPGGSAQAEYVTDGRSVRCTTKGDMFGLRDGTVRLVLAGSADLFVLDRLRRATPWPAATGAHLRGQSRTSACAPQQRSGRYWVIA